VGQIKNNGGARAQGQEMHKEAAKLGRLGWVWLSLRQNHKMKLFVAGLPYDMDHRDLQEMFELYGTIKSAKVVMDHATRKSKGFGFVEFAKESEARETMELLNGKTINGKAFTVKPAEEQQR